MLRVCLEIVFKKSVLFSITKKLKNIFGNKKIGCFQMISFSCFYLSFLELFLKKIIQICIMIKNKTIDIKKKFKIYTLQYIEHDNLYNTPLIIFVINS